MKKIGLYEISVILFFLIIPIIAIFIEVYLCKSSLEMRDIAFKWFVFSGVGLRLGSAGIKQIFDPQFTAREIFKIKDNGAISIVREIGFANICFSVIGIISLFSSTFREPAAIAGGLYFGLAGFLHLFKKRESFEENFAMISDLFIFFILVILLVVNIA